ncbi:isopeptide-forming domain-containing fimbrial protein, partial [Ruminococcus sp. AF45-4BH]
MIQYMIPGLWRAMHETIHRYLKKKNEKGNEEREREETSMKKFKKLLVGLLAGAMMLGSMSATAFAADASAKMPTIDTTKTGSLTIHKYEYTGNAGSVGTGESTDSVPEGAKKLSGIKFEITKAYGLDSFYKTDSIKLPTVAEAKAEIKKNQTSPVEGTTDKDKGIVKFDKLELGIYLVHESDSSAQPQITGKIADFLVSIPMTNKDEDDWLYDVHVFPKNSSTYAGVTLQKKGKIGSADATVLEGATFVLQKKGTGVSWTTITNNNKGVAIGTNGVLTTGADGKITVSDLAPGTYRFVETSVPKDTGYIMNGRDTKEFEITTAGEVKIGNEGVDTNQNPIEVINYKPNVEKEVINATGKWGNDSDYSAGDEVPYRVTVDVPSNIKDLREFVVTDTMEHQTYIHNSLKIYSDEGLSEEILKEQYTVTENETTGWSISF